jgi:hypothetical protein
MKENQTKVPWVWLAALGCFVIAGSTGSLLRFGLLSGLPAGLALVNVRHAHSHLMYFGWATPALMVLIVAWLPQLTGRKPSPRFFWVMGATIVVALLAYIFFLQFGYQVAQIGDRRLPLSVIMHVLGIPLEMFDQAFKWTVDNVIVLSQMSDKETLIAAHAGVKDEYEWLEAQYGKGICLNKEFVMFYRKARQQDFLAVPSSTFGTS